MNETQFDLYKQLIETMDDQVRVYRGLLDVVRKEKDILITANLDELNENNRTKEAMLLKVRALETIRVRLAADLSAGLGLDPNEPRLLDMALKIDGVEGDRLRNLHSVLELLLKRVQEHNKQNEVLVKSALENITGAMSAIRDTLQDKPTYQRKGNVSSQPTSAGQLVSKEA